MYNDDTVGNLLGYFTIRINIQGLPRHLVGRCELSSREVVRIVRKVDRITAFTYFKCYLFLIDNINKSNTFILVDPQHVDVA